MDCGYLKREELNERRRACVDRVADELALGALDRLAVVVREVVRQVRVRGADRRRVPRNRRSRDDRGCAASRLRVKTRHNDARVCHRGLEWWREQVGLLPHTSSFVSPEAAALRMAEASPPRPNRTQPPKPSGTHRARAARRDVRRTTAAAARAPPRRRPPRSARRARAAAAAAREGTRPCGGGTCSR